MRRSIIDLFELPKDVILDLPRLTVVGREQLMIENHRGIASFDTECVIVGFRGGQIRVTGQQMKIASIDEEEILLAGSIDCIAFSGERG